MEVFTVGGAVRDQMLGLTPKDFDYVVVGATPEDMIAQGFSQVGADFPVFLHPETDDEYALARTERKNGVGYHGFDVSSDPSVTLADDLSRRDLTINAMARDSAGNIHDPFGGQQDLKEKTLRHVSPAFAEDPLRVVRLARFSARFPDFMIAHETFCLACDVVDSGELNHLPNERFWAELEKVLGEPDPGNFFMNMALFDMTDKVNFFRELYNFEMYNDFLKLGRVADACKIVTEDSAGRLMFHTAITAAPGSKTIRSAPMRTQNLFDNLQRVRNMKASNVDTVFDILQHAKVWSQATDFDDLVQALHIMYAVEELLVIGGPVLKRVAEATKTVTAADYIDKFKGPALGEAIREGRKAVIEGVLYPK